MASNKTTPNTKPMPTTEDADEELALTVPTMEAPEGTIRQFSGDAELGPHFNGLEMAPIFVKFKPGSVVSGVFEGFGEVELKERVDRLTGEVTTPTAPTVKLRVGGVLVEFLSAHDLNRSLKGREGRKVTIARGPNEDIGDRRVGRYRVGFEPRAERRP